MLLYRPLLPAHRSEDQPEIRRLVLRELSNPALHCEPEELLESLGRVIEPSALEEPMLLWANVVLSERALKLGLTTRDAGRQSGELWTAQAGARDVQALAAIVMKTLFPGQGGEFLDGNPIGHIDDAGAPR